MELQFGRPGSAYKLFVQSYTDVPEKSLHFVFLELLRFEEYRGNFSVARSVLAKAREVCGNEWKVFLESVLFEQRRGNLALALKYVEKALRRHGGTGRLWAAKVQLVQDEAVLDAALNEVPKSGEVWCEGARVCLNPFNNGFGLPKAARYLDFAIKFTPQYGDSFAETVRHRLLNHALDTYMKDLCDLLDTAVSLDTLYSPGWKDEPATERNLDEKGRRKALVENFVKVCETHARSFTRSDQEIDDLLGEVDLSDLEVRVSNADPNYGSMWFRCRPHIHSTSIQTMRSSRELIVEELRVTLPLYLAAHGRRLGVEKLVRKEISAKGLRLSGEEFDEMLDERLKEAPPFSPEDVTPDREWKLLDFATGVGGGLKGGDNDMKIWRALSSVV